MPLSVVQSPARKVSFDSTVKPILSYWNAVHNKINFKLIRLDAKIISSGNNNGNLYVSLQLNADNEQMLSTIQTGDLIFVSGVNYNQVYAVNVASPFGFVILNTPYNGSITNGYVQLLGTTQNYYVEVAISLYNPMTQVKTLIGTDIRTPFTDGTLLVDPSSYLKSCVNMNNTYDYKTLNVKETNYSNIYTLDIREHWQSPVGSPDGTPIDYTGDWKNAGTYFFTNSAKQPLDKYGQNMGDFVPIQQGNLYNGDFTTKDGWKLTPGTGVSTWGYNNGGLSFIVGIGSPQTGTALNTKSCFTGGQPYTVNYKITFAGHGSVTFKLGDQSFTVSGTNTNTTGTRTSFTPGGVATNNQFSIVATTGEMSTGDRVTINYVTILYKDYDARFLMPPVRPTYFPGYPFELNFIYSELIATVNIKKIEQPRDVNSAVQGQLDYDLDNSQFYYVNHLKLAENYSSNIKSVDVWLETDGNLNTDCYIQGGYILDGYYQCLPIAGSGQAGGGIIPELGSTIIISGPTGTIQVNPL